MAKYIFKRFLHGILSVIAVVLIVMFLIYSVMDRNLIFAQDPTFSHLNNNSKQIYKYSKWEEYGYLDYVSFVDYLNDIEKSGDINQEKKAQIALIGRTESMDTAEQKKYVEEFSKIYEEKGYKIVRLDAIMANGKKVADGGAAQLFAVKDEFVFVRLFDYLKGLVTTDDINYAENVVGERGITFTLHDPVYGGDKFSPAIIGNGTEHKYLLYFDSQFPYVHQNVIQVHLGLSYSVNRGIDVFDTMTQTQGKYVKSLITYPTGLQEERADDLHTAKYVKGSLNTVATYKDRFTDDYTSVVTTKNNFSKMGFSFVIGIISVMLSYLIGIPVGIAQARRKDSLIDKIGSIYIVFIIAVPSLAYIFLFKAIGGLIGLPTTFDMSSDSKLMYVLPIISLSLPSVATLMKWLRRYMIDQMNSDYVKFARSSGLTESEIFSNHILKNAIIPIVHNIPSDIIFALTGAIITERVYVVPGAGNLLTTAINNYDNGVIVGVTMFYALLSVISIILGDVLMSLIDPRISFTEKDR